MITVGHFRPFLYGSNSTPSSSSSNSTIKNNTYPTEIFSTFLPRLRRTTGRPAIPVHYGQIVHVVDAQLAKRELIDLRVRQLAFQLVQS